MCCWVDTLRRGVVAYVVGGYFTSWLGWLSRLVLGS